MGSPYGGIFFLFFFWPLLFLIPLVSHVPVRDFLSSRRSFFRLISRLLCLDGCFPPSKAIFQESELSDSEISMSEQNVPFFPVASGKSIWLLPKTEVLFLVTKFLYIF